MQVFSSRKPLVTDLRICGSTVFVKDNSSNLDKFDAHSEECMLLSHDDWAKGYSGFQPSKRCVPVSRDVRTVELSHVDVKDPSDYDLVEVSNCEHPLAFAP